MRKSIIDLKNAKHFQARNEFVSYALRGKKLKLLDVGNLGDGVMNVDVKKIVEENGGEHYGLDVNENLANHLRYKNQKIGDLHDLSGVVSDGEFDAVYAGQIIEHTWAPGKMMQECNRIVKDGGYLILDTPNIFDIKNVLRILVKGQDTVGLDHSELVYNEAKDNFKRYREKEKNLLSQPQHKVIFSPAMLRQLLNMYGFQVETYAFIGKRNELLYKAILPVFPRGAQKLGIIAKKVGIEKIFKG